MPLIIDGVKYIAAKELLSELSISRVTLWRWRDENKIPKGRLFRGRRLVFTESEAEAIREYARRVEPIRSDDADQLRLFVSRR
jgi:predicted DNA-binding transcriptional regulator AlpA